jgi:HEAT repeats/PBS lyase HEAT-like repeat
MRKWLGVFGALIVVVLSADGADVPDLIKKMRENDISVRRQAAKELSELGPEAKEALATLIKGLKDNDLFVRRFSAQAIGKIGPEASSALPALRNASMNPKESKEVQEAILSALGKLGKGGVDVLIAAIKDKSKEGDVRRKAIESLGDLGPDAREALTTLVEALGMAGGGAKKAMPASGDLRIEVCTALGLIANSKDDAAIKALEMITAEKSKNRALKSAASDALKKIKNRN